MMRTFVTFILGVTFIFTQSCSPPEEITEQKEPGSIIATFADQQITLDELKNNLNRNSVEQDFDSSEVQDFYPSYIDYRLKLYEGYQLGYHRDSTILAEFNDYAADIADRYWIENQIKKDRIEVFKERFEHELKAFHILNEISEDAPAIDTIRIYNRLMSVRDSLLNGADPEEMNQKYSSKRDGRPVGGQLSWITAGSTIQPFEDAVYSLDAGQVSYPVRSQFGYHVILLEEIRPRTPQRLIKHIFVRKTENGSGQQKINQAYEALNADSLWSDVLQKYTEDPSSKNRDGLLGWVGYGSRFPTELVEAAIQTDPQTSYSKPYEMSYGYHIMKVDSVQTFLDDEQREEYITSRLEELGRLTPDQQDIYDRIVEESDFKVYRENVSKFLQKEKESTGSKSESDLIRFNNQTYTSSDFQNWIDNIVSVEEVMQAGNLIDSYTDYIIRKNYVDYTRNQYPEFAKQVDHFLEGLIVFKVNEQNIWNPEAVDRSKLNAFYESNRTDYKKGKTFHYTAISSTSDSLMDVVHQQLLNGTTSDKISDQFEEVMVTSDSTSHPQQTAYPVLNSLNEGEFSEPVSVNNRIWIYMLNEVNEERILSFDEAFDQVFSDYQPTREQNYIDQLAEKYNLKLYPENLN